MNVRSRFPGARNIAFTTFFLALAHGPSTALAEPLVFAEVVSFQEDPGEKSGDSGIQPPSAAVPAAPDSWIRGQSYLGEVEPNGTFGTASPLAGSNLVVRANLFPNGDIDFYSFSAAAGDRVYAATMTSFSAGSSTDSQITLLASDGTTVIEFDEDNGSFAGLSSSIAGAIIPTSGTSS